MKCVNCGKPIAKNAGDYWVHEASGNVTCKANTLAEPEPTEAAPSQEIKGRQSPMDLVSGPHDEGILIDDPVEREAVVGGEPPKDDGLCLAGCGASRDDPSHSIMRCSPKIYPQPETPRPEMGKDALRDFVEQAQSICESATGPSVSDISKLRRLGKIAFPQGFKTLAAASGTESAPECDLCARGWKAVDRDGDGVMWHLTITKDWKDVRCESQPSYLTRSYEAGLNERLKDPVYAAHYTKACRELEVEEGLPASSLTQAGPEKEKL